MLLLLQLTGFHVYLKCKNLSTYEYIMAKRQSVPGKKPVGLMLMTGNHTLEQMDGSVKSD